MTFPTWTRRAVLAAGVALAAATAPFGATAQTPPGVLVVGQIAEPKSLDPAAVTAVNDFRILVNLYEGLLKYKPGTLEVAPGLAESWEVSEDGTEYTFTLREGVVFHDGTPFDAEAVKFNFDRMLDENHPYHDTGPFPLAFFFSAVDGVEAVDARTVKFTLSGPYAPFLSNLAYPHRADRVARRGNGRWCRFRPQPFGHRPVPLCRMALERSRGNREEPKLLG
jgi:peptide/nickel transport system substrate-binding protein